MSVVIETTLGDITVDLLLDERPRSCLNFLKLCKVKYYNFCLFHKVERNFIAQTGDPTGTGRGGESIFYQLYGDQAKYFDSELKPRLKHKQLGTLSMVNNGNNMNGSQFFITLGEDLTYLDEVHTVFGEVTEGLDVLVKINDAICDNNNIPFQDIRITHMVILHDPYEDPPGLSVPPSSPKPTKEHLTSNYLGADEEIDDNKGLNGEEIEERIQEREAKARATILEMVGDIPDADVKPPENVLFVCKLNPVTTSEDLEIIFSRFGPIISCEVIKDKKTGESLQYAFIEFEKEEHCENAYFKMDNVLIDDRRIHVDFSQSVAKLYKNRTGDAVFEPKSRSKHDRSIANMVIKDRAQKSDGYNLIFDSSGSDDKAEPSNKNQKKKKHKRESRSPSPHSKYRKSKSASKRHHRDSSHSDHETHLSQKQKSYAHDAQKSSSYTSERRSCHKENSDKFKTSKYEESSKTYHKSSQSSWSRDDTYSNSKYRTDEKYASTSHKHKHKKHKRSQSSSPEYRRHKSSKHKKKHK